jgi:hypothetical protein
MDKSKFILCYIANEFSNDFIKDSMEHESVERGLISDSTLNDVVMLHFSNMKDRGYFPVGIIIDPNSNKTEFLFKRHPQQTESMRLKETIIKNKTEI